MIDLSGVTAHPVTGRAGLVRGMNNLNLRVMSHGLIMGSWLYIEFKPCKFKFMPIYNVSR